MTKHLYAAFTIILFLLAPAWGQDPANNQPVTRQEFEALKKDNAELRAQLTGIKSQQTEQATNAEQDAKDSDVTIKAINDKLAHEHSGLDNLVIAGDANVNFIDQRGNPATFAATVSPLFLWQPTEKFLFEAAFGFGVSTDGTNTSSTNVSLGLANASYLVTDYMEVGGGLFATPFGAYHNHFDPPWINKFPDDPLVWSNAIGPTHSVGLFVRGAVPISTTKLTYDVYVSNGPNLVTNAGGGNVGSLNFDDFTDLNNDKAVGGRIGFLPWPSLEVGYSVQISKPNPQGFRNVYALLQAVDLNYKQELKPIRGTLQFQTQWVWSNVGTETYDPTGSMGIGPLTFKNHRNGGYVELNYRPTQSDITFIRNLEFCSRYDWLFVPLAAPGGGNEERLTLGIDYWFTPSVVLQTAYEVDKRENASGVNAFLMQLGIGL